MKDKKENKFKRAFPNPLTKFRSLFIPENSDEKIEKIINGGPPMKVKDWFKEKKSWWSIWILFFILTTALATCSELKITYEYKTPPVVKKLLGNK